MTPSARAVALFASRLQPSDLPSHAEVSLAIEASLLANGGESGCLAFLAMEYGDHPAEAAARMSWALDTIETGAASALVAA